MNRKDTLLQVFSKSQNRMNLQWPGKKNISVIICSKISEFILK